MPTYFLSPPARSTPSAVEPTPMNGSRTTPNSGHSNRTIHSANSAGNCAGWLLPLALAPSPQLKFHGNFRRCWWNSASVGMEVSVVVSRSPAGTGAPSFLNSSCLYRALISAPSADFVACWRSDICSIGSTVFGSDGSIAMPTFRSSDSSWNFNITAISP